jgi:hypothetical protein
MNALFTYSAIFIFGYPLISNRVICVHEARYIFAPLTCIGVDNILDLKGNVLI